MRPVFSQQFALQNFRNYRPGFKKSSAAFLATMFCARALIVCYEQAKADTNLLLRTSVI